MKISKQIQELLQQKTIEPSKRFVGQWYRSNVGFGHYLLASVDCGKVNLIAPNGYRWGDAVKVDNIRDITEDEWDRIKFGGIFDLMGK